MEGGYILLNAQIKKIMGSAFMLIAAGIIVAAGFALPFLQKAQQDASTKKRADSRQTVFIEGQEISGDSPFYNSIIELSQAKEELEKSAATKADDGALELVDILLTSYLFSDKYIKSHDDYRHSIAYEKRGYIIDMYVLNHIDELSAGEISYITGFTGDYMDEQTVIYRYLDLDEKQRAESLETGEEKLEALYKVEANNDHRAYYRYQIDEAQKKIDTLNEEIEALEKDIAENPENEDLYSSQIENNITIINDCTEITIAMLEYRLDNDILQTASDWRYNAVIDKQDAMIRLLHFETLTEAEFEENVNIRNDYRTYNAYVKQRQDDRNEAAKKLLIADLSLESGKPDMKYVLDGPRKRATGFLWYSSVISMFAVIVGGSLISSEFRQGTIRLLLIRPKSRLNIIFNKSAAFIVICFALYFASAALNILANGILYGFSDYTYPNYTISSGAAGVNFIADYAVKFLICFITVLFLAVISVALSTITKNTAVSVAAPIVLMLGSLVFMMYFLDGMTNQRSLEWVFKTPLPFISMFMYYITTDLWWKIEVDVGFGMGLILALTAAAAAAGAWDFKTADIKS